MKKIVLACCLFLVFATAIAQEVPTTPVPPVPAERDIREAMWQMVRMLDMEIQASLNEQRFLVYLIGLDPSGTNAAGLRQRLLDEQHRMLMLLIERQWYLDQIVELSPL